MQEGEPQSEVRESPRDAQAILAEVGLTPEALRGKSVLYFGNEPLVVEGANITPFDFDHYIETDELGVGEDGVDYVIAVGESMLQDALGDEDRQILLGQVAETLKTPGKSILLIAKPYVDPQFAESPEDLEIDYERAIEDMIRVEFRATYDISDSANPYLSIQAVPPKS